MLLLAAGVLTIKKIVDFLVSNPVCTRGLPRIENGRRNPDNGFTKQYDYFEANSPHLITRRANIYLLVGRGIILSFSLKLQEVQWNNKRKVVINESSEHAKETRSKALYPDSNNALPRKRKEKRQRESAI